MQITVKIWIIDGKMDAQIHFFFKFQESNPLRHQGPATITWNVADKKNLS